MQKKLIITGLIFVCFFVIWTLALTRLDVQPIGPNNTSVAMATFNRAFHNFTGVHFIVYMVTDWLGLVPIFACLIFAILGLVQCIKRKHIKKVDPDILMLGLYYIVVISIYLVFENVVINYRPVLINGYLEASYPSSTTLLVLCVMPTVQLQVRRRMHSQWLRRMVNFIIGVYTLFMLVARTVSGVHWLSDIIGGVLISTGLVILYCGIWNIRWHNTQNQTK